MGLGLFGVNSDISSVKPCYQGHKATMASFLTPLDGAAAVVSVMFWHNFYTTGKIKLNFLLGKVWVGVGVGVGVTPQHSGSLHVKTF